MQIKVRTLTGKEIELDIEPDTKVRRLVFFRQFAPAHERANQRHDSPNYEKRNQTLNRSTVTTICFAPSGNDYDDYELVPEHPTNWEPHTGRPHQGEGRREGGYSSRTATSDFWRKADVSSDSAYLHHTISCFGLVKEEETIISTARSKKSVSDTKAP
ncbi:hypothetical protein QBC45DRAFT_404258 [Copromyces sp. CBS 386.78]|nr:hypothetical protein QBC45DRAFT_404258 [Copromyces sp. CBS 386.78]